MKILRILVVLTLFLGSCKSKENKPSLPDIAFDKAKWHIKDKEGVYTDRSQMINDLLNNYHWVGVKRDSVERMLGKPDVYEPAEDLLMYNYEGNDADLFAGIEALVFELKADSTVKKARHSNAGFD